jgi:hypothetical protein
LITDESGQGPADQNIVSGNYIGLVSSGDMPLSNQRHGVNILAHKENDGTLSNVVEDNVISGNTQDGVHIEADAANAAAEANVVRGNIIGLNADGDAAVPNGGTGVRLRTTAPDASVRINQIGAGGPAPQVAGAAVDGNVISGNATHGVELSGPGVDDNDVFENLIGTASDGATPLGNGFFGVRISEMADGNQIGADLAGNVIADNAVGVRIGDAGTTANLIQGNFIGTNAPGDELGNDAEGVYITSEGNTVGGPNAGEENVIKFNAADGVRVEGDDGFGNAILRNSIDENVELGINLVNDGNGTAAPPALTSAENGSTHITGVLVGDASTEYHLEFFASPACDDSAAGEGEQWIGSSSGQTAPNGVLNINADFGATTPAGMVITTTATDPDGNTSEFSNCVTVTGGATPSPTLPATPTLTPNASASPAPTGSPAPVQGDADCDGDADLNDMMAILEFVALLSPPPECFTADANCDFAVNEQDALLIALYLADVPAAATPPCSPVGT